MHLYTAVKGFKILSGNKILTSIMGCNYTNEQNLTGSNPNLDLVNIN